MTIRECGYCTTNKRKTKYINYDYSEYFQISIREASTSRKRERKPPSEALKRCRKENSKWIIGPHIKAHCNVFRVPIKLVPSQRPTLGIFLLHHRFNYQKRMLKMIRRYILIFKQTKIERPPSLLLIVDTSGRWITETSVKKLTTTWIG